LDFFNQSHAKMNTVHQIIQYIIYILFFALQ